MGAVPRFTTLTLDGLALQGPRHAATLTQVREWPKVAGLTRITGPVSALAILIPGL